MSPADPYFADVASLFGDSARANILSVLMDGRARTAKELAFVAGVSPQTTSGHLAKLAEGRLLVAKPAGRHRLYRLADPLVARAIEALMALSSAGPPRHRPVARGADALRAARTCYDHLAGRLGVGLTDAMLAGGDLRPGERDFSVTNTGRDRFTDFGVDLDKVARQRRALARSCLDWSERRPHLAGALGAAIAQRCFELGWIERQADTRAVTVTNTGRIGLRRVFGLINEQPKVG
jgi:DNA-binding transcriptional ArsR family regulator